MQTYTLNITVPAKNKKFYERVVLNLFPLVFHSEKNIRELFELDSVVKFIQSTVKTKRLYDDAIIYIRNISDLEHIEEETLYLKDLVDEENMSFDTFDSADNDVQRTEYTDSANNQILNEFLNETNE